MRVLKLSLNQALDRLTHLKELPEDEPAYDHPRSILSPLPVTMENASKLETSPSHSPLSTSTHTTPSVGSGSQATSGTHDSSLPKDDRTQAGIIPKQRTEVGMMRYDSLVNFPQLLKSCKALLELTEKVSYKHRPTLCVVFVWLCLVSHSLCGCTQCLPFRVELWSRSPGTVWVDLIWSALWWEERPYRSDQCTADFHLLIYKCWMVADKHAFELLARVFKHMSSKSLHLIGVEQCVYT